MNKYENVYDKLFDDNEINLNSDIKLTIDTRDILKPTPFRISTMTMITDFNCNINLGVVDRYFKIDDIIISMVYGDKPVKSINIKKKNNRPFFNQATIIVKLDPLKKINVKIFSNGKIQMTGVKRKEDGEKALNMILKKLHETQGKIPITKLLLSQQIELLLKHLKIDELPDFFYIFDEKPAKKSTWYKKLETDEDRQKQIEEIEEKYQNNKKMYMNTFDKNMKYRDLIIEKKREEIEKIINISKVLRELLLFYGNNDDEIFVESIENFSRIKIGEIKTVLINSDFNVNFKIKRNILHSILKDKYNIVSRYEPGIYPGVNNKYYWNNLNIGTENEGRCKCTSECTGKGDGNGNGDCKKITIAAFQSGSIIITGAKQIEHIEHAYNFINKVIKDNYDLICKIDVPFADMEQNVVKEIPKKYIKTSDIIYIKKDKLNNKLNKKVYKKYMDYISSINTPQILIS